MDFYEHILNTLNRKWSMWDFWYDKLRHVWLSRYNLAFKLGNRVFISLMKKRTPSRNNLTYFHSFTPYRLYVLCLCAGKWEEIYSPLKKIFTYFERPGDVNKMKNNLKYFTSVILSLRLNLCDVNQTADHIEPTQFKLYLTN